MESENKILLVLDLDETLVHARLDELSSKADFQFADYYVYLRPHLTWFLTSISKHFQLAIWSSADDNYVHGIIDEIKPKEIEFEFIWGRSRCTTRRDFEMDQYVHEKRLKKVKKQGYEMGKILIVDDSPEKTRDNYGNAIYINAFEGSPNDSELKSLYAYLVGIKDVANVRTIEKRGWKKITAHNKV